MKFFAHALIASTLTVFAGPAMALPGAPALMLVRQAGAGTVDSVAWRERPYRHHPRYGGTVGPNGGYRVNRYGYGNYVGGPGGFAGYPAGSAGAQIYRQKQEWKCQDVPEMC